MELPTINEVKDEYAKKLDYFNWKDLIERCAIPRLLHHENEAALCKYGFTCDSTRSFRN